jgi:hypothetical protein
MFVQSVSFVSVMVSVAILARESKEMRKRPRALVYVHIRFIDIATHGSRRGLLCTLK